MLLRAPLLSILPVRLRFCYAMYFYKHDVYIYIYGRMRERHRHTHTCNVYAAQQELITHTHTYDNFGFLTDLAHILIRDSHPHSREYRHLSGRPSLERPALRIHSAGLYRCVSVCARTRHWMSKVTSLGRTGVEGMRVVGCRGAGGKEKNEEP